MPEGRLISHFKDTTPSAQGFRWNELWESEEHHLWDRGQPSRPLLDYLKGNQALVRAIGHCGNRQKALVPGCGLGHDVLMLAQNGFETHGLEVSQAAIDAATKNIESCTESTGEDGRARVYTGTPVPIDLIYFQKGDFFQTDWQKTLHGELTRFDLVYDYTFLCALHPNSRKAWADRMSELVKPGKYLICLEFPLWKDNALPGPPWGLSGVYWDLLAEGGNGVVSGQVLEYPDTAGKGMFERVQYIRPSVSYPEGKGTDMLSVWRRK